MSSSPANSLRPAWHRGNQAGGGRGFQPPPTVASERTNRSQSLTMVDSTTTKQQLQSNFNKFSALDDDDEVATMEKKAEDTANRIAASNPRSEALRSGLTNRASSTTAAAAPSAAAASKLPGRSLADLVARAPERERSGSHGSAGSAGATGIPAAEPRTVTSGSTATTSGGAGSSNGNGNGNNARHSGFTPVTSNSNQSSTVNEATIIRYTRERLLSLRPKPSDTPCEELREAIDGTVILSETPQDPVCWDNFDAESIWATVQRERRPSVKTGVPEVGDGRRPAPGGRRETSRGGRWERGVALPPPDQVKKTKEKDAENPSDLWDDPQGAGAATDFSAFGSMPDDEPFDFEKMAEATRKFEEEMHGNRSSASSEASPEDLGAIPSHIKVDPKRPLATAGTTIQSGPLDEVNVFEDFDDPNLETSDNEKKEEHTIKGGDEDPDASSRLMAMIGVTRDLEPIPSPVVKPTPTVLPTPSVLPASTVLPTPAVLSTSAINAWGVPEPQQETVSIPLNPWGGPLLPGQGEPSFDLDARLRAEMEQKAREAELLARRQEEEAKRLAQQQAEERARQLSAQQQMQQHSVQLQAQVELVLMERISTVLENSWGQSDLISILSTLHAEDPRVIPLLNSNDALRALIIRNPRRVTLRPNPVFGTEMAVLLMTNAQWQQEQLAQQQAEAQARSQQEELKRRELQQRQLHEQRVAAAAARQKSVRPGSPWFYSDPQNNIQGPFRGDEMRQWLEAGYFKSDLPISQQPVGPFHPLSAIFPDLSVAFVSQRDAAEEEARERARLEAERAEAAAREQAERELQAAENERRARVAELERRARAEAERRAIEEAERAAAAAVAAAENENANESSAQLKMMLGLGGALIPDTSQAQATKAEKRLSKSSNKKTQAPKAIEVPLPEVPTSSPQSQPKNTVSVWGGASQPITRRSMSEIQHEEAKAAAILAMQQQEGRRSSTGGWANVAAARVAPTVPSAWSGAGTAAKQQRPAALLQKQSPPSGPAAIPPPAAPTRAQSQPSVAKATTPNAQLAAPQNARAKGGPSSTTEEFGAKMSPVFEKWCKDQMQKINGTDDLTLVSFCMTLNDPVEIRQYLTTYLGNSGQVNNFATEFINRKSGTKAQEEWETTANVKKARKKKGGSR